MTLTGTRVLILGMGVTGRAVAEALQSVGASSATVDRSEPADHSDLDGVVLDGFDLAVASPGWSPAGEALTAVEESGIEVISEVELAWRLREPSTPWVLVTGTNGKTTTVRMAGAVAHAAGMRAAVVGNVGDPVVASSRDRHDLLIVEASSFQLHYTSSLEPHASVCLNVDEDHLDWHRGSRGYWSDKAKVYQGTREACLYPVDNSRIEDMVKRAEVGQGCRAVGLSQKAPRESQLGLSGEKVLDRAFPTNRRGTAVEVARLSDLDHLVSRSPPSHLVIDALAAIGLVRSVGVAPEHVEAGLKAFRLDPHRTELVGTIHGVEYIDDSKATNPHAARAAFGGIRDGTAVWVVGGLAKGTDLAPLIGEIAPLLRAAVLIGLDQDAIVSAFERHARGIPVVVIEPGDTVMERAVEAAHSVACPGDTVLLSPACASMDQFRDYADRGEAFSRAVKGLER